MKFTAYTLSKTLGKAACKLACAAALLGNGADIGIVWLEHNPSGTAFLVDNCETLLQGVDRYGCTSYTSEVVALRVVSSVGRAADF